MRAKQRRLTRFGLAVATLTLAGLGVFGASAPRRLPRTADMITNIIGQAAHVGDCTQCHTEHGGGPIVYPHALLGPNDNALCASCHTVPWAGGSYAGTVPYAGSAHGSETPVVWPGPSPPPRTEPGAARKCLNCHDPHGWEDGSGVVPGLRLAREEMLCLTCHDGSPALTDVRGDQLKPYRHPTQNFSGRHGGGTETSPSDFGASPLNRRHAECEDCHNAHLARADRVAPTADQTSKTLLGVSRLSVINGPAGSPPSFTFIAGQDTLSDPGGDWQLCFKCHSSWTTQPGGQTDQARVLNPGNPSFHPVEAVGANPGISPAAFVSGWSAMSRTPCGSCHGSDSPTVEGPHGSLFRHLLRAPYEPASNSRPTTSDELCFRCHAYDVYANPGSSDIVRGASRFNTPGAVKGHAEHVGEQSVPCGACHVTHGSTTQPYLIVTGRNPGLIGYTSSAFGGTCTVTCHISRSYTVNYAR